MKNFIKKYWKLILPIALLTLIICISYIGLSTEEMKQWYSKPLSKFTALDIIILIIINSWLRNDNSDNNNQKT